MTGRWGAGRTWGQEGRGCVGVRGYVGVGKEEEAPQRCPLEPVRTWRCPPRLGAEAPLRCTPLRGHSTGRQSCCHLAQHTRTYSDRLWEHNRPTWWFLC